MMHFSPNNPLRKALALLKRLQKEVNDMATQEDKVIRAGHLWNNRKSKDDDKPCWKDIEDKLEQGAGGGICQYCEFDRTTATEHFYPKKYFPRFAFKWDNYLRACHKCNSIYKGDKFAVFNPRSSDIRYDIPITRGTYPLPPTDDAVLINPRTEQPQDFLRLDLLTGAFVPHILLTSRKSVKAKYTIELLHLNTDANLLRYRKKAIGNYLQKLKEYVGVTLSSDFAELEAALSPSRHVTINTTRPLMQEKEHQLGVIKADILDDLFPTAWHEIKSQKDAYPHIESLFDAAPEALTW